MIKDSSKIINLCDKVSKIGIYLLVFLMPIFFLPWTINVIDFNKQALLVILVFVSLFAWLLKVLITGKSSFNLSWIHIPVIVFFLALLLSTIFSVYRYGSFWGWPQAISESLLTFLGLTLLYFLIINVFEKQNIFSLIICLVFSCFLAILYGTFQLFGKFILPFAFSKGTGFNTIGTPNSLAVFTAVLLPLTVFLLVISRKRYLKIFFIVFTALSVIVLLLVNFQIAWWLVIAGAALIITLGVQKRELFDNRWLILPMFFLTMALFFSLFKFQVPGVPSRPIEVPLASGVSWDVSWKALKENPILGSGPGTFLYNFSKYKDVRFNQSSFWNMKFQEGSSEFLTLLGTGGILGTLSFLALIGLFLFYGIKSIFRGSIVALEKTDEKSKIESDSKRISLKQPLKGKRKIGGSELLSAQLSLGIFISFITLSIGYFLYTSSLSLSFVFFFLIASFVSLTSFPKKEFLFKASSIITLGVTFAFTLVFIIGLGIIILEGQKYVAETNYLKGVMAWKEGSVDDTLVYLEKAVKRSAGMDLYWRELSQVYLQQVSRVVKRTDLPQEEITRNVQLLINNAINSARTATDINPENVANWSVRGFIYQNLIGVVGGTMEWSVKSYDEASKLEPINPYFPTQTGISYLREVTFLSQAEALERVEILSQAKEQFEKAIELKSDYAPAHFQLATVYQNQGRQSEAIKELEKASDSAPFDTGLAFQLGLIYYRSKDYQKARVELERAVVLNPNYANALYFLGLTYDQLGAKGMAIEKFKRVSALNPDNLEVKKILSNLRAGKDALAGIAKEVPPEVPIKEEHSEIE